MAAFDFKTLTFIKASEIPANRAFGRTSTPKLGISENGQGRFSKALLEHEQWAGKTRLWVGFDPASRTLGIMPIGDKLPKGVAETDLFIMKSGAKHPDMYYISMSGILKQIGYDFVASGNQTFPVEIGARGEFSVNIPTSLVPPIKVPRKPKGVPASVKAEAGSATRLTTATAETEEDPFAE